MISRWPSQTRRPAGTNATDQGPAPTMHAARRSGRPRPAPAPRIAGAAGVPVEKFRDAHRSLQYEAAASHHAAQCMTKRPAIIGSPFPRQIARLGLTAVLQALQATSHLRRTTPGAGGRARQRTQPAAYRLSLMRAEGYDPAGAGPPTLMVKMVSATQSIRRQVAPIGAAQHRVCRTQQRRPVGPRGIHRMSCSRPGAFPARAAGRSRLGCRPPGCRRTRAGRSSQRPAWSTPGLVSAGQQRGGNGVPLCSIGGAPRRVGVRTPVTHGD